jgi:membrane fusion protein (multidrug efflux system)
MTVSPALKKRLPLIVAATVVLALLAGGAAWWTGKQRWETTDNAFVKTDTTDVSPQIDGYVVEVPVADNARVRAGDVLVRLDDADARAALARAEANYQAALAGVGAVDARAQQEQAVIASRAAAVSEAEAQARLARGEVERYAALAQRGWVSDQRIQTERAAAARADAALAQARAGLAAEQRSVSVLGSSRAQSVASVEQARAELETARLALERTVIRAPVDGVVGARSVRVGQYVRPGASILSIVPLGDAYVVANFKETQVARLKIGQEVEIRADAFRGLALTGHIDSFAPATGSEFALIPIENATGNFTRITQRVPVRIRIDQARAAALRPGLSVEVRVDVRSGGGAAFADAGVTAAGRG